MTPETNCQLFFSRTECTQKEKDSPAKAAAAAAVYSFSDCEHIRNYHHCRLLSIISALFDTVPAKADWQIAPTEC